MPVEVVWDDEDKTIILQSYTGRVVLDDYYQAIDAFANLATSVTHEVHSIMDRTGILISQGTYMRAMRYGNSKMPDNLGLRVIVKANVMTRVMIDLGQRLAPRLVSNVHLVDTLEGARELIEQYKQNQVS